MIDQKYIARMILFHRKKSGLSQLDLADIAGVGKTVIFDIEKGKESIRFNSLKRTLDALNISIRFESPLMDIFAESNNAQS